MEINTGGAGIETESALHDPERLSALRAARLNTHAEERFDRLTRLAAHTLGVPIVLISCVGQRSQFFKSAVGLEVLTGNVRHTDLAHSFCKHIVELGGPLVVTDARNEPGFRNDLAVTELGVVAYAGVPLRAGVDQIIGVFCAIELQPREWTEEEVALLADLAETVMSEIRLQQAKDAAEDANRAKDRFLAVLSHELRMPISPALMIVQEMASDPDLPQSVRDDAGIVRRNIEQQVRLIDDLLDLTRIENGKLDVRLKPMDLCAVVETTVAHFRAEAAAKNIQLTFSGERHCIVQGDSGRLAQVFGNLLKNAIKFTPAQGRVVVHVDHPTPTIARVTVRDSGIGITAEVLPDLFEAFAQGPRARVREFGGLGLGLAIAKGIMDEHHGQIEATSDGEHCGTTFTVTLPLASASDTLLAFPDGDDDSEIKKSSLPIGPAAIRGVEQSVRILLVDDHEDTLRAMTRLLRKLNHRVVTAGCVTDALKLAQQEEFDLLISDLGLPDGTGLDLMRQLLARKPILGIALTGYGSENDHRQTLDAGFSAHLTKPIDMRSLAGAIRTLAQKEL